MASTLSLVKDVRGCMTRFDPLTPEVVAEQSEDGLTYDELKEVLSVCGMDINKVVFDGSRSYQNAFYANFEQGHYCWIPFKKENLKEIIRVLDEQFHSPGFGKARRNHEWETFYMMDVPLPMQIWDFERRYKTIEPEKVFSVWSYLHTHIDYANGMWKPEVLDYVFAHAPQTELPEPDENGKITIYRGMGEKSLPAEEAISWSTDPVCALWFANRSARGTRLVFARVSPEQILVYNPGYHGEHEVILKPGVKPTVYETNMIPSTEEYVPRLLAPVTKDFFHYGSIALTLGYPEEHLFQYHGIKHILRVLLLTLIYCEHSCMDLSEEDKQILIYFSLLHDIGRDSEGEDEAHGDKSVELIRKKNIRIKGIQLSKKGYRIAKLLIRHHCREDDPGIDRVTKVPNFSARDIVRALRLYRIAKDMDGLDRVRFNGLDFRYLRTPYARRLPLVAGGLLEEPLLECIKSYRDGKLVIPDGL